MLAGMKAAIESLYSGRMTIIEYQPREDVETGLTSHAEMEVLRDIPCRLSHSDGTAAVQGESAAEISQRIRVFYAPDILIKPGSKLVIRQNGTENVYCASGIPRIYAGHAEVDLTYFKRWA